MCIERASVPVLKLCSKVVAPAQKDRKILDDAIDTLAFLGNACSKLTVFQREKIKLALKKVCHVHCGKDQPFSPTLLRVFGDDLAKQVRDAKETTKLSITIGSTSRFNDQYDKGSCRISDQPHQKYGNGKEFNHFLEKGNKKTFKPYYKTNKEDK